MPETHKTIKSCIVAPDTIGEMINTLSTKKTFDAWVIPLSDQIATIAGKWANPQCDDLTGKLFYIELTEEP